MVTQGERFYDDLVIAAWTYGYLFYSFPSVLFFYVADLPSKLADISMFLGPYNAGWVRIFNERS